MTTTTTTPTTDTPESVAARLSSLSPAAANLVSELLEIFADRDRVQATEIARLSASERAMREALGDTVVWIESEADTCSRSAEEFKRDRSAGSREMHHRCDAAADAHRKDARRLRAALSTGATQADSEGGDRG